MRYAATFTVLVVAILLAQPAFGDEPPGLSFVLEHNPPVREARYSEPKGVEPAGAGDASLLAFALIRLYQVFLSPQTPPACNFYPSCSQYGLLSVQRYGVIVGMLMAADRLLRCNGRGLAAYPLHRETGRRYDPPERNSP